MADTNETLLDDGSSGLDRNAMETQITQPDGQLEARQPDTALSDAPQIPDLTILAELGRGGMGVVYEGRQGYLDRRVAVKVLLSKFTQGDSQFAERFQREAKILAQLHHPHIVACYQAGTADDGNCFLVMEFIEGSNLDQWIRAQGPLAPRQALGVVKTIAHALDYANKNGIIHRDVKPENILLGSAPMGALPFTPKLVDLGLARPDSNMDMQLTAQGVIMGTPATMAPEQFDDPDHVDQRADIYGLGCVLYQALCGKPAFSGTGFTQLMETKLKSEAPNPKASNASIPNNMADLVKDMLAKDRNLRIQNYEELLQRITAIEQGKQTEDKKHKSSTSSKLPVLIILVLVLGIGFALWYMQKPVAGMDTNKPLATPAPIPDSTTTSITATTTPLTTVLENEPIRQELAAAHMLALIPNTSQLASWWKVLDGQWGREEEGSGIAGFAPRGETARIEFTPNQKMNSLDAIFGGNIDEGKTAAFNNCSLSIYFVDDSMWEVKIADFAAAISIVTVPPQGSQANDGTGSLEAGLARRWPLRLYREKKGWHLALADFKQDLGGFSVDISKIVFAVKDGNIFLRDAILNQEVKR